MWCLIGSRKDSLIMPFWSLSLFSLQARSLVVVVLGYFSNLFEVHFSADPVRVLKERESFVFFMEFIEDCEGTLLVACLYCGSWTLHPRQVQIDTVAFPPLFFFSDGMVVTESGVTVALKDLLVFFSGSDETPPMGFSSTPVLGFTDEEQLAVASTCALKLTVPCVHRDYETFKNFMVLSLKGHDGFGCV